MNVRELIQQGEGQRVEFKESFSADNKAIESLCAFSNSQGGTVLVGVSDVGAVVGASLGKNTLENFANKLAQHTQPPLYVCLTTEQVDSGTVVIISVKAHRQGELFYAFGKPFIRVGKTNQVMSPQEQKERLLMGQSETPWTVQAGGPEFQLMLGFKGRELKLGCSFQITAQTQPGGVECRWIGLGTDTDWAKPMKENQPGKYQMKEIIVNPDLNLEDNIITLEIRFWLEDGKQHGGRWLWPLKSRGDGVWELKQEQGSHVFQPRDSDWW